MKVIKFNKRARQRLETAIEACDDIMARGYTSWCTMQAKATKQELVRLLHEEEQLIDDGPLGWPGDRFF